MSSSKFVRDPNIPHNPPCRSTPSPDQVWEILTRNFLLVNFRSFLDDPTRSRQIFVVVEDDEETSGQPMNKRHVGTARELVAEQAKIRGASAKLKLLAA